MTSELYKSNPGVSIPPPQQNTGNNIITDQQCSTPTKLTNLLGSQKISDFVH